MFRSWFIDFEPFKNIEFVESELGMIPKGWEVMPAENIYNITIGKTPPRKEQQWFTNKDNNIKWVSISDMGNCGLFINGSNEKLTPDAVNKFNILIVPKGSILLSFKLTIGRVAISGCNLTTNEAIARFEIPTISYREYTYFYLKLYDYSKLGNTSSIATAVNSKIIKRMNILVPQSNVLKAFHEIVKPIFEQINYCQQEISVLSNLRDALLPKLMSGEISVEGAKI